MGMKLEKVKEICYNIAVSVNIICRIGEGEWFTAHGKGITLGYFGKEENRRIAEKLREVFSEWIDNGHNDFSDENTIILCVELTDGLLFSHGTRYEI